MDPDIPALAATIASTLGPSIPFLVKAGEAAANEMSKKTVGALWDLFKPKVAATPALADAINDIEKKPDDPDNLVVLRVQIRKVLEADPDLVSRIRPLLEDASMSTIQTVIGNRNVIAGRDISGSTVTHNERPAN
jgi:hypothetical protein